jgi:hypothetical protein
LQPALCLPPATQQKKQTIAALNIAAVVHRAKPAALKNNLLNIDYNGPPRKWRAFLFGWVLKIRVF